ncbi:hypothetical protein [Geodermatophilus sabuli]|uniref:Histidine kinase n=1 Tax=Geodermatophilus sabuli TaxID=1564158 RepID=A0A285E9D8_9ACTN|nr:hypothetical protein [Geodermatophilus sabuli]MBB3085099.1 hypothetical protein [Geodermatophilus sabuli]SNX95493.1 hypothetical protein SAMN06893097_102193 [Geodermatophilus sabuli]
MTGPGEPGAAGAWLYRTALVLIPVVGVVVLTADIARTRAAEAASAERAEDAVRAVAQLDAARSGVEQEIVQAQAVLLHRPMPAADAGALLRPALPAVRLSPGSAPPPGPDGGPR